MILILSSESLAGTHTYPRVDLSPEARKDPTQEKLAPNWERPFRIHENLQNGAYRLETLDGKTISRTWNASHLKFCFS